MNTIDLIYSCLAAVVTLPALAGITDPVKPWSCFVHPVTCIGMPLQTARTGIQVTPDGTVFTGEHELALSFGATLPCDPSNGNAAVFARLEIRAPSKEEHGPRSYISNRIWYNNLVAKPSWMFRATEFLSRMRNSCVTFQCVACKQGRNNFDNSKDEEKRECQRI